MLKNALACLLLLGVALGSLFALQPVRQLASSDRWVVVLLVTVAALAGLAYAMWAWSRHFSTPAHDLRYRTRALASTGVAVGLLGVTLYHMWVFQPTPTFFDHAIKSGASTVTIDNQLQRTLTYRILQERGAKKAGSYYVSPRVLKAVAKKKKPLTPETLSMLQRYLEWSAPHRAKEKFSTHNMRRWFAYAAQAPKDPVVRKHTEATIRAWWPLALVSVTQPKHVLELAASVEMQPVTAELLNETSAPAIELLQKPIASTPTLERVQVLDGRLARASKNGFLMRKSPALQAAVHASRIARTAHLVGQPVIGQPRALANMLEPRLKEAITLVEEETHTLLVTPKLDAKEGPHVFWTLTKGVVAGATVIKTGAGESARVASPNLERPEQTSWEDSPQRTVFGDVPESDIHASLMWVAGDLEATLAAEKRIRSELRKARLSRSDYERYLKINRGEFRERYYDRGTPFSIVALPVVIPSRSTAYGRSIRSSSSRSSSSRSFRSGSYGRGK